MHDAILGVALEREHAFLAVLSGDERETLIRLLHRLHENLPAVEAATAACVARRYPRAKAKAGAKARAVRLAASEEEDA